MYEQVFLGSGFKGLEIIRENIWRQIQQSEYLKCYSLQWGHYPVYSLNVLQDIVNGIQKSAAGIFIFGLHYGDIVEECLNNIPEKLITPAQRKLSFTHLEFRLLTEQLERRKERENEEGDQFIPNRLFVIRLKLSKTIDSNKASPPATDTTNQLESLVSEAEALGIDVHTVPVTCASAESEDNALTLVEPVNMTSMLDMIIKQIEGDERLRVNRILQKYRIEPNNHIQILGWSGLEDYALYKTYMHDKKMRDDELSFLTMNRSVISLPSHARYFPRRDNKPLNFDFVFADIEVVPHYMATHSILAFTKDVGIDIKRRFVAATQQSEGGSRFVPLVRRCTPKGIHDGETGVYGIPLMYGFNELLLNNATHRLPIDALESYADFDLGHLLTSYPSIQIGIWGWWVSSFPIILYAHMSRILMDGETRTSAKGSGLRRWINQNKETLSSIKYFADWINEASNFAKPRGRDDIESLIRDTTNSIINDVRVARAKNEKAQIHLYGDLTNSVGAMNDGLIDVLIGSSSSMLPCLEPDASFIPIIPNQGVFVWINCVCVYGENNPRLEESLVSYWLKPEAQKELSARREDKNYVGIPVITDAFNEFLKIDEHGYQHIHSTVKIAQPEAFPGSNHEHKVPASTRPFSSKTWLMLEQNWNKLSEALCKTGR